MSKDRCDFDLPIPSSQLHLAVSRAFETLGKDAKNSLLAHLQSQGINLEDESQHTLNQLMAALKPIFPKDAADLVMEMVWNHLKR